MEDKTEQLKQLDDKVLIDVVKNYRQYGYDEKTRNSSIEILESRGIDISSLKLRGDFENKSYDYAESSLKSFEKLSKLAFIFYGMTLISQVSIPMISVNNEYTLLVLLIAFWVSLIAYMITFVKSFVSQADYYQNIGQKESQLNPGLYFTIGMFFYIIMFFVFRKQMREDIKLIR